MRAALETAHDSADSLIHLLVRVRHVARNLYMAEVESAGLVREINELIGHAEMVEQGLDDIKQDVSYGDRS
jgi:hypothetical protein